MEIDEIIARGYITKEEVKQLDSKLLRKINLIGRDGDSEGIWANLLNEENLKIYDDDSTGVDFYVVLQNNALAYYPNRSWGLVVKCVSQGLNRPKSHVGDLPLLYAEYVKEYF